VVPHKLLPPIINMRKLFIFFLISTINLCAIYAEPTPYDNGAVAALPEPLPKAFVDYQLLPLSRSPDSKYGLIYPKLSRLNDLWDTKRLILVRLTPFKVLADIPMRYSHLAFKTKSDYCVSWTKDSSSFLMVEGIKWGADKVFLCEILPNKKIALTDLTIKIVHILRPYYLKSKAKPYSDKIEFIFVRDDRGVTNESGELIGDKGWIFTSDGNIKVDCTCTSNPSPYSTDAWFAKYTAIWNREKKCFTGETFTGKQW